MSVPVKIWARDLGDDTRRQLAAIAGEPYVYGHVAAMPDAHVAQGVAVGTVFATRGVIVPTALGGDLGCGVSGVRFNGALGRLRKAALQTIVAAVHGAIPTGDEGHRGAGVDVPAALLSPPLATRALEHQRERLVRRQLGTLGGGNHFIELDRDPAGDVWLLVHSGSRGLGQAIAQHHVAATKGVGQGKLRGAPLSDPAGAACLADTLWACAFARHNRDHILWRAAAIVSEVSGVEADPSSHIDTQHNFVAEEEHEREHLLVHRKGAIAAPDGSLAIIPGSMGTATYVVRGRGEATSWRSASHGAGRAMNRSKARATIRPDQLKHAMRHVVFDEGRLRSLVEEAPAAYKDIHAVLDDERDLIEPLLRLEPIAVMKG